MKPSDSSRPFLLSESPTVRVFLSSIFRDFAEEWDLLGGDRPVASFFMGFIGQRYGWVPDQHQYSLFSDAL